MTLRKKSHKPVYKTQNYRVPRWTWPHIPNTKYQILNTTVGFTLVELMVAAGIFSIFIIVIISISSQFIFTQRRDIAEQDLLEDLRLSLETFNREARTAYGDTYLSARPDGTSFIFRNQNGACVNYRLQDGRLERAESPATQPCDIDTFRAGGIVYTPLTGSGIELTNVLFDVVASTVGTNDDFEQEGRVTLCHIPPGNPDRAHTITVGAAAVPDHVGHGDALGPCGEDSGDSLTSQGFVTVVLEAQAKNQTLIPVTLQSTVVSRQVIPFPTSL